MSNLAPEQMTARSADTDERLARIEQRIAHIEATMGRVEQSIAAFLAGPGRKMMRLLGVKAGDNGS